MLRNVGRAVIVKGGKDSSLDCALFNTYRRSKEPSVLKAIDAFTPISGLKVNHDKTQVLMLGKKAKTDTKICPDLNLNYVTR